MMLQQPCLGLPHEIHSGLLKLKFSQHYNATRLVSSKRSRASVNCKYIVYYPTTLEIYSTSR